MEISWAEEPTTRKVLLNWKERSGPPVAQPSRVGFGSRLLKAAFAQEGASANIIYEPDGVRCSVVFIGIETSGAQRNFSRSSFRRMEASLGPIRPDPGG